MGDDDVEMPADLDSLGGTYFQLLGTFDEELAQAKLNRASTVFLCALRDMGGDCPDDPTAHDAWANACRLPNGKSFKFMRRCLIATGNLERFLTVDRIPVFKITAKGLAKAAAAEGVTEQPPEPSTE